MQELIMEIKCNFHSNKMNYGYAPIKDRAIPFRGQGEPLLREVCESADKFVKRPVATTSATGLNVISRNVNKVVFPVVNYAINYVKNIKHTYEHKVTFAMIEKELYGKYSIDSLTHDLDKLVLYILGFPRSFVSKFHRRHSEHHVESHKKLNLKSMLCDNVASTDKKDKLPLRVYYNSSEELQSVEGFKQLLEKYNYGENIDFDKIHIQKKKRRNAIAGALHYIPLMFAI